MNPSFVFLTTAYCLAIFFVSADTNPPLAEWRVPGKDKVAHFVMYAGLAGVVSVGMRKADRLPSPRVQVFAPIAFATVYGLSDELHQLFVPHRSFSLLDLAADASGAIAMQYYLCVRRWRITPLTP